MSPRCNRRVLCACALALTSYVLSVMVVSSLHSASVLLPQALEVPHHFPLQQHFLYNSTAHNATYRRLQVQCSLSSEQTLLGVVLFNGSAARLDAAVSSCLAHTFYPRLEREAARRMLNPSTNPPAWCSRSPALLWYSDLLILVARITRCHQQGKKVSDSPNQFRRDHLYTERLDAQLLPVAPGGFLPTVLPTYQKWMGFYLDGPQDPRPFTVNHKPYFLFHAAYVSQDGVNTIFPVIWDYLSNRPIALTIHPRDTDKPPKLHLEKNWMPIVIDHQLYFVKNIDPLEVLKCDINNGSCTYVLKQPAQEFKDRTFHIRGGTNFVLYEWPYYIGVAHSVKYTNKTARNYFSNLIVLRATDFSIVYMSANISFDRSIFKGHPHPHWAIPDPFFFPVTCLIESRDVIAIGGHINDRTNIILRVSGVEPLMTSLMHVVGDERNTLGRAGQLHDVMEPLITKPPEFKTSPQR